ncbi:sphingosine kinase 1-like [Saccostrea echinata]|uniref:sphingosine kinase 1-like n=1 Tax=Saccostrea echinata TaxID=191078 RepID=UPI002A7FBF91|nr:sphingosine kinase 1-like [Saccostrea echinata]
MEYNLAVDGLQTKVTLNEEKITFKSLDTTIFSYQLNDVIGCDEIVTGWFNKTEVTRVWLIEHGPSNLLLKKCKVVSGEQRKRFQQDLTEKTANETKRPKRLLVMINTIGGSGSAKKYFRDVVQPVFKLSGISMDVIFTEHSGHMINIAKTYDFSNTDGITILGGDGSYHEVVNVLLRRRQEEQGVDINDQNASLSPVNIPIALIPTGTGCGLTEYNTGCRDVLTACLHVIQGRTVPSHLLALYNNGKLLGFGGTGCSYGFMTDILYYSDRMFRWLGRIRYYVVPIWMFLFKSQTNRAFDAKVTCYASVTERLNRETNETEIFVEDKKLLGHCSFTSDTVTFKRKFWNMMIFNINVMLDGKAVFDVGGMYVPKPDTCTSFFFYGDVSVRAIFRFFKHIAIRTPMDVTDNELEALNVQGMKVEVTDSYNSKDPEMTMSKRLIQLDGEMYQLDSPSFQLWHKLNVLQFFSSYR